MDRDSTDALDLASTEGAACPRGLNSCSFGAGKSSSARSVSRIFRESDVSWIFAVAAGSDLK